MDTVVTKSKKLNDLLTIAQLSAQYMHLTQPLLRIFAEIAQASDKNQLDIDHVISRMDQFRMTGNELAIVLHALSTRLVEMGYLIAKPINQPTPPNDNEPKRSA